MPKRHECWASDCEMCSSDAAADTWISDAESVIHQYYGSDGTDDEHNDWVHDLANALYKQCGPAALDAAVRHLIEVGDVLHDIIAPATDTSTAAQLDMWNAAVKHAQEAS